MAGKYMVISLIATIIVAPVKTFIDFDKILEDQMNLMQKIKHSHKSITQGISTKSTLKIDITDQIEDKQVLIIIKGVTGESCEASLNQNTLSIITPQEKITIQAQDNFISVLATKEQSSKSISKDPNKANEPYRVTSSNIRTQITKGINYPIDLEKQSIDYNKCDETLSVKLKYDQRRMGKSIPVTIIDQK